MGRRKQLHYKSGEIDGEADVSNGRVFKRKGQFKGEDFSIQFLTHRAYKLKRTSHLISKHSYNIYLETIYISAWFTFIREY